MQKFLSAIRKPAHWILIGCISAYLLFDLLYRVGISADNGQAGLTVGGIFGFLALAVVLGGLLIAMLTKREQAARTFGALLLAYVLLSMVIESAWEDPSTAAGAFHFIAMIATAVVIVAFMLEQLLPNHAKERIFRLVGIVALLVYGLFMIMFSLTQLIQNGINAAPWYFFMGNLSTFFVTIAVLFAYLVLVIKDEDLVGVFPAKKANEEAPAEEEPAKEEAPAEEVPAEESPVEETPEEQPEEQSEEEKPVEEPTEEAPATEPTEEEKPAKKKKATKKDTEK